MKDKDFEKMVEETMQGLKQIRTTKGKEYRNESEGHEDVFNNFKVIAERIGTSPANVLSIYLCKHFDSIFNFIKKSNKVGLMEANKNLSEPIEGRCDDILNYILFLKGMIKEESEKK